MAEHIDGGGFRAPSIKCLICEGTCKHPPLKTGVGMVIHKQRSPEVQSAQPLILAPHPIKDPETGVSLYDTGHPMKIEDALRFGVISEPPEGWAEEKPEPKRARRKTSDRARRPQGDRAHRNDGDR